MKELKKYCVYYIKGVGSEAYVTRACNILGIHGNEEEGTWVGYAHDKEEAKDLEAKAYYEKFVK